MEKTTLIRCGKLYDGIKDELQSDMEILVKGKLIERVGRNLPVPEGTEMVDLTHLTVTPGMIDSHNHDSHFSQKELVTPGGRGDQWDMMSYLYNAQRCLERGFTTIRLPGGGLRGYGSVEVKRAIDSGVFHGARMLVAAHIIGPTGNHGDFSQMLARDPIAADAYTNPLVGDGPGAAARAARREIKYGCDFLKIMPAGGFMSPVDGPEDSTLTDEELKAIFDVARGSFKPVMAHVYAPDTMQKLIRFGIKDIEHGSLIDEETARMMEDNDVYLVPTFTPYHDVVHMNEERLKSKTPAMQRKLKKYQQRLIDGRRIILESNIKLGYGTDIVGPLQVYDSWNEYACWMDEGVNPFRILKAATSTNAEICGVDSFTGSIVPLARWPI